jgi:hypothetical protein
MKKCSKCKEEKPLDKFSNRYKGSGLQSWCKKCMSAASNASAMAKRRSAGIKGYIFKESAFHCTWCNRPNLTEQDFHKHNTNKFGFYPYCKYCKVIKGHGLTYEQSLTFKDECYNDACKSTEHLNWDHDHSCCPGQNSCGKCIRGRLCQNCNLLEGKILINAQRIRGIIEYLERTAIGK